jgi:hypothetical protein
MNERIKELMAQATRIEEPDGLFPREVFDREKFAELIVRECIAQVRRDENGPAYEAVGRIARHFFRVEE